MEVSQLINSDQQQLKEILQKLRSNRIPVKYQKQRRLPGGGAKAYAPWHAFVKFLDHYAPDAWEFTTEAPTTAEVWYAEKDQNKVVTGYTVMPTISVAGTLTIRCGPLSLSRGSVGTVKATEAGKGLPADAAKWICFKQCCRLFGIWLADGSETSTAKRDYQKGGNGQSNSKRSDKREQPAAKSTSTTAQGPDPIQSGQASAIANLRVKSGIEDNRFARILRDRYGAQSVEALQFDQAKDLISHLQSAKG